MPSITVFLAGSVLLGWSAIDAPMVFAWPVQSAPLVSGSASMSQSIPHQPCDSFASSTGPESRAEAATELRRSHDLADSGRLDEAQKAAERSLRLQRTADGWYQLGLILFAKDEANCSLAAFTSAAALRTPQSDDLRIVALDYVLLDDEPDAEKWLHASLTVDQNNAEAWYDLGRVLYQAKRYPQSLEALHKALSLRPRDGKAETYLGLIAETSNDGPVAEAAYRRAIADQEGEAKPFALPYRSLGVLLGDSGHLDEAFSMLDKAVRLSPNDPINHAELGACFVKEHRWSEARREFETAIRLHPTRPAWHFQLGRIYHALGMEAEAKIEFATVKRQTEINPQQGPEQ